MSNVLIGIIGVILFIGLALAGALFLGPRFQESTNNSKASAAVQAVSQVANAANMRATQEGITFLGSEPIDVALVNTQYLKSIPSNPTNAGGQIFVDTDGAGAGPKRAIGVVMRLADENGGKAICEAIRRQTGSLASGQSWTPAPQAFTLANMTTPAGCQWDGGSYYVFARL